MRCTVATCTYPRRFLDLCTINLITNYQSLVRSKLERKPYSSSLIVVDLWVFDRVADFLENGRFTRIGPADNENPEPSKSLSEVFDWHSVGDNEKAGRWTFRWLFAPRNEAMPDVHTTPKIEFPTTQAMSAEIATTTCSTHPSELAGRAQCRAGILDPHAWPQPL